MFKPNLNIRFSNVMCFFILIGCGSNFLELADVLETTLKRMVNFTSSTLFVFLSISLKDMQDFRLRYSELIHSVIRC